MTEGLILTLKKWRLNVKKNGKTNNTFSVFGYYDLLEISKVSKWSEFSPTLNRKRIKNADIFSNEIQLKLLMPQNADAIEESSAYVKFDQIDSNSKLYKERPLLTIALIRFTESRLKKNSNDGNGLELSITELCGMVTDIISDSKYNENDTPYFAIYPSIGYMDAVIIFRSNNFSSLTNIMFALRGNYDLISSCYTIPCIKSFPANSFHAWIKCEMDKDTKMSIRVNLKPGVSTRYFIERLNNEIELINKKIKKYVNNYIINTDDIHYEMFGNSDLLILSRAPASLMSLLFFEKNLKLLQTPFDLIASSRSSIRKLTHEGTGFGDNSLPDGEKRKIEEDFIELLNAQYKSGDKSKLTPRLKDGLLEMASFYFDMTSTVHAFDIRKMMDPVLDSLIKQIIMSNDINDEITMNEFTPEKFNKAIMILRDTFTDLMNDFARANKHMFEERWFKHPSVASASKLIMGYHSLINSVIDIFSGENTYTFLTSSGGVDHVTAECLFEFYRPNRDTGIEHRLIILRLSEADLYFPSRVLFYSLHECYHYIGVRYRPYRNTRILQALSNYISHIYNSYIWGANSDITNDFRIKAKRIGIDNNDEKLFLERFDTETSSVRNKINKGIIKECLSLWKKGIPQGTSDYSAFWNDEARVVIWRTFSDIRGIAEKYTNDYLNGLLKISKGLEEGLLTEKVKLDFDKDKTGTYINAKQTILTELDQTNVLLFGEYNDSVDDRAVLGVFEALLESFKEAYSDLCSILTVKYCNPDDYLAAFYPKVYSETDKETPATSWRIASVIKTCFPASYTNNNIDFADIEYKEKAKTLIENAKLCEFVVGPLCDYLSKCKQSNEKKLEKNETKLSILHEIYKSSIAKLPNEMPEVSMDTIMKLIEIRITP